MVSDEVYIQSENADSNWLLPRRNPRTRFMFLNLSNNQVDHGFKISVLVNIFFTLLTISMYISNARRTAMEKWEVAEPYSPAWSAVKYEYRRMIRNDTRFVGYPGDVWRHSMHELLSGTLIRISGDELAQLGTTSVRLEHGGYAVGLGVAHNLHCIKKLKEWLYRDYFHPGLNDSQPEFLEIQQHADHCLDFMRQSHQCHADSMVYTLHWRDGKLLHDYPEKQKCVSWDGLQTWMHSRAASSDELIREE